MFRGEREGTLLTLVPTTERVPLSDLKINEVVTLDTKKISELHLANSQQLFPPEAIHLDKRTAITEQNFVTLDPAEISSGLKGVLAFPETSSFQGKFIDVPASFTGRFAETLKKVGFDVRASDIHPYWVSMSKSRDLNAQNYDAERLPRHPKNRFATIMFEGEDVINHVSSYLVFLREIVGTQKGLIYVESRENGYGKYVDSEEIEHRKTGPLGTPTTPAADAYSNFSKIYGFPVKIADSDHLRFYAHDLTNKEARNLVKRDLLVLYKLRNLLPPLKHDESGFARSDTFRFSPVKLAKQFGMETQELIDSMARIFWSIWLLNDITRPLGTKFSLSDVSKYGLAMPEDASEQQYFLYKRKPNGDIVRSTFWKQMFASLRQVFGNN